MTRIVTSTYRYKRPPRTAALVAVVAAALLAGCAADGRPSDLALRGYWYHDANLQGRDLTARTQLVERDLEKPGYSH
jgi:hypothetical protein